MLRSIGHDRFILIPSYFLLRHTPCAVGGISRRCDLLRNEPPAADPLMDIDETGDICIRIAHEQLYFISRMANSVCNFRVYTHYGYNYMQAKHCSVWCVVLILICIDIYLILIFL